ncbi:MAG: von Willebrand factor type A domain-containing protein [Verrucomicrobia bacterium]|nr:von Willebrand factor type A domain-containing protein [Verrucomicrobiota bacterium]
MKIDPDDPNLSAYALGELDEPARAEIEQAVNESLACRQVVEEVQQAAALLAQELGQETCASLSEEQRQILREAAKSEAIGTETTAEPEIVVRGPWRRFLSWGWLAAAACLVLLFAASFFLPGLSKAKAKAQRITIITELSRPDLDSRPADAGSRVELTPAVASAGNTSSTQNPSPPAAAEDNRAYLFKMDPRLLERYGLVRSAELAQSPGEGAPSPAPGIQVADNRSAVPPYTSSSPSGMSPELMRRYGLGANPSGPSLNPSSRYGMPGPAPARRYAYSSFDRAYSNRAEQGNTATYPYYPENPFLPALENPISTFSLDVDTASYANIRRFLNQGQVPPRDAVRIEEMINYFTYSYPAPKGSDPFAVSLETAGCPWNRDHRLISVGLKAREIAPGKRPPSNLVFLIDVSGSMRPPERLPLLKQALRLLTKRLSEQDHVAIVVYASNSGVALSSTAGTEKERILAVIDRLEAGGSTNGGEGIQQAYAIAASHFIPGGVNRVILCTDGDFNVGITDQNALVGLIQEKARRGVFLSALGVGTDNYKDALLQNLADKGNGNYHYIDTIEEAQKVLVDQMSGTLVAVAKDVKVQIEFNPARVSAYRLIGYEKRLLRSEDFNNDAKDAGEVGAGHAVMALYEVVPAGASETPPAADNLKYQPEQRFQIRVARASRELLTLKLRYKRPEANESQLLEFAAADSGASFGQASPDFKFAAAVASFGLILRDSAYKGTANFDSVLELAQEGKGTDDEGYRAEFINLVGKAKAISGPANGNLFSSRFHPGPVQRPPAPATKRNVKLPVPLTREQVAFAAGDPSKAGDADRIVAMSANGEIQDEARADKLVVNLSGTSATRFAVARISVLGDHPELIKRVNEHRDRLLDVAVGALSSLTLGDVEKPGFRNLLRQQLLALFNEVLGRGTIQEVIITEFIVQ